MNIEVPCGQCGRRFQVDPSLAGKRIKCKACGEVLEVPKTSNSAPSAGLSPAVKPVLKSFDEPTTPRPNSIPQSSQAGEKPAPSRASISSAHAAPAAPSPLDQFDDDELIDNRDEADDDQPMFSARPSSAETRTTRTAPGRKPTGGSDGASPFWTLWKIVGVAGAVVVLGVASVVTSIMLLSVGSAVVKRTEPIQTRNPNDSIAQNGRVKEDTPLGKSVADQRIEPTPTPIPPSTTVVAQDKAAPNPVDRDAPPIVARTDPMPAPGPTEPPPPEKSKFDQVLGIAMKESNGHFEEIDPRDDLNRSLAMGRFEQMLRKYGPAGVVNIDIEGVPDVATYKALTREIRNLIQPPPKDRYSQYVLNHMSVMIAPVKNPADLARKIDFGTIKESKDDGMPKELKANMISIVFKGLSPEAVARAKEDPKEDQAEPEAEAKDKDSVADSNGMPHIEAMLETNEGFERFSAYDDLMKTKRRQMMLDITKKYGLNRTLMLDIKGVPDTETYQAISKEIQSLVKPKAKDRFSQFVNDRMSIALGPVKNPEKFGDKITFGVAKQVGNHVIEVEFKALKPAKPQAESTLETKTKAKSKK